MKRHSRSRSRLALAVLGPWVMMWAALLGDSLPAHAAGTLVPRNARRGDRTTFVHLFEWTWNDIALECENFLGPNGYGAVQVSPPNEHAVLKDQPWYQRYQPVTYALESRSGTRAEFIDMVRRCKSAGVEIYVDAVINHMTWLNKTGAPLLGSAGTAYYEYSYPGLYEPWDFHRCGRNGDDTIRNYQDRWEVQNCNLATLADLKTESDYVRDRIADYLNDLLEIGVAGFRIDAAKHIPAGDIQAIFSRLKKSFYAYQEVIDFRSEPIRAEEYFPTGDVMEFRYPRDLAHVFGDGKLAWLNEFGEKWGYFPAGKTVVFVDNHDIQRGHGAGGEVLTHKDGQKYALASVFMLAWPYGYPQVMSSYRFTDASQGPPADAQGKTRRVYNAAGEAQCGSEWVCEHRWAPIAAMVGFRNYTAPVPSVSKWWSNGNNQIAFARGNRGFVVLNREGQALDRWFDTGLPSGVYCDVISSAAGVRRGECNGRTVRVDSDGWAQIQVAPGSAVAIHGGMRVTP